MITSPTENKTPTQKKGPGLLLAQTRTDLHLAQEDVAAKLHLATSQIQALENDDYASLPGATYVRGYLKSYALMLGLAPEPILEAHAHLTASPATPDFRNIAPQREIDSRHHQVRFVTYLMVAIVIGLAIAWWQGRDVRPPNPILSAQDAPPAVPSPDAAPVTDSVPVPENTVAVESLAPVAPASSTPDGQPKAQLGATPTATAVVPAVVPAKPATTVPVPAPVTVVPPKTASAPVALTQPSSPVGPQARLIVTTEQDSWIDIRDASQKKLLYDTVPAGHTVVLQGAAPVSVFLGNAAGVRLEYNGQSVDVAHYKRGLMARFTLGEAAVSETPAR